MAECGNRGSWENEGNKSMKATAWKNQQGYVTVNVQKVGSIENST
jgi:hypothetical protein